MVNQFLHVVVGKELFKFTVSTILQVFELLRTEQVSSDAFNDDQFRSLLIEIATFETKVNS